MSLFANFIDLRKRRIEMRAWLIVVVAVAATAFVSSEAFARSRAESRGRVTVRQLGGTGISSPRQPIVRQNVVRAPMHRSTVYASRPVMVHRPVFAPRPVVVSPFYRSPIMIAPRPVFVAPPPVVAVPVSRVFVGPPAISIGNGGFSMGPGLVSVGGVTVGIPSINIERKPKVIQQTVYQQSVVAPPSQTRAPTTQPAATQLADQEPVPAEAPVVRDPRLEMLFQAIGSPDEDIRKEAVRGLKHYPSPETVDLLKRVMASDPSKKVKKEAKKVLKKIIDD